MQITIEYTPDGAYEVFQDGHYVYDTELLHAACKFALDVAQAQEDAGEARPLVIINSIS